MKSINRNRSTLAFVILSLLFSLFGCRKKRNPIYSDDICLFHKFPPPHFYVEPLHFELGDTVTAISSFLSGNLSKNERGFSIGTSENWKTVETKGQHRASTTAIMIFQPEQGDSEKESIHFVREIEDKEFPNGLRSQITIGIIPYSGGKFGIDTFPPVWSLIHYHNGKYDTLAKAPYPIDGPINCQ